MITVKVPASSANLGPGFDVLGLALTVYNKLEIEPAAKTSLTIIGEGADTLPTGKENLLLITLADFYKRELGTEPPALKIKAVNNIPLARGMGSSSAAIVGAILAANELSGRALSRDEIFSLAADIEGHPDNVAAAVYGGATIAYPVNGGVHKVSAFKPRSNLSALLLVPDKKLLTTAARQALPDAVTYRDAVFNISRTALLVKALMLGESELLATAMDDRLHQPYRAALIPELNKVIEICRAAGADGAALSGAGPTVIALTTGKKAAAVGEKIEARLQLASLAYTIKTCGIDLQGATII